MTKPDSPLTEGPMFGEDDVGGLVSGKDPTLIQTLAAGERGQRAQERETHRTGVSHIRQRGALQLKRGLRLSSLPSCL